MAIQQNGIFDFSNSTINRRNTFDGNESFEELFRQIQKEQGFLDNKIGLNNNYLNGLFASPLLSHLETVNMNRTDRRTGFLKSLFTVPL